MYFKNRSPNFKNIFILFTVRVTCLIVVVKVFSKLFSAKKYEILEEDFNVFDNSHILSKNKKKNKRDIKE
ncbi:hypothetical protein V1478_001371 [Vespula squamosa]|uniref:Uncharacterized protein n=1 Tax=Vespula squamosa TaxID=30214 RepID=A0ABD2C1T4_VESSQ